MPMDVNLIADRVKAMGGTDKAADRLGEVLRGTATSAKEATQRRMESISDAVQAKGGVDAYLESIGNDTDKAREAIRALFLGF